MSASMQERANAVAPGGSPTHDKRVPNEEPGNDRSIVPSRGDRDEEDNANAYGYGNKSIVSNRSGNFTATESHRLRRDQELGGGLHVTEVETDPLSREKL